MFITFIQFAFAFQLYSFLSPNMADESQSLIRDFFTKFIQDEFWS